MTLPANKPVQSSGTGADNFTNYKQIKLLGRGASGTAYSVERQSDKKILVYKKLACLTQKEEEEMQKETTILSGLQHPYIVGFIEAFRHESSFYIVMEYCNGGSLQSYYKDKLKNKEFTTEEEAWKFIFQMASAIGFLHQNKILHRDMKPENILLLEDNTVKLSDFGISKQLQGDIISAGTMCGTELYLSPELTTNAQQSFPADVWGIGLIMREVLTQNTPFEAKAQYQLIQNRVNGVFQLQIDPRRYSQELIYFVNSMCRVKPEERPTIPQILDNPYIKQLQQQSQQSGFQPPVELLQSQALKAADELAASRLNEQQRFAELQSKIRNHEIIRASPMKVWVNDQQLGYVQKQQESLQMIPCNIQQTQYKSIHLAVPYGQDKMSTMGLDPVFDALPNKHQFIRMTARFYDSPKGNLRRIGIVDARVNMPDNYTPGFDEHSIGFDGASGRISHCGSPVCKAEQYGNEDFVTIEVYLPPLSEMQSHPQQPRDPSFAPTLYRVGGGYNWYSPTVSFAINERPQVCAFENCPTSFRFCVTRYYNRSSVEIIALAKTDQGTIDALPERETLKW